MKEQYRKKWQQFLTEKDKPNHYKYEARLHLTIDQDKPIDRTEVMDSMRAIPEITTVYREREISTSPRVFVGEYIIRFILPVHDDAKIYYNNTLGPKLKSIPGLGIQTDYGYEKIGDE